MSNHLPSQKTFRILVVLIVLFGISSCSSVKNINPISPTTNGTTQDQIKDESSNVNLPFELNPTLETRESASSGIGFEISNLKGGIDACNVTFTLRLINNGPALFDAKAEIESITPSGELFVGENQKSVLKYGILVRGIKSPGQEVTLRFPPGINPSIKGFITGTTRPLFRNNRTILHTDKFAEHPRGFSEFSGSIIADQVLIRFKEGVSLEKQYSILDEFHLIPVGVNLNTRFIQADILDGQHPDIVVANLKLIGDIDHAEVNSISFIDSFPDDPAFDPSSPVWEDGVNSWGYRRIQAPEAWDFYNDKTLDQVGDIDTSYETNGKIILFILDTGYKYHDEFNIDAEDEQFLNLGLNIVNPGTFPDDDHGHGVLVTGIAMAEGNNQLGFAGLAWNTRIVPIKTNDYAGNGDEFRSGIGISYAKEVALDYPDYRCVGNMSYGTHSQNHLVDRVNEWTALEDAWTVPNIQFVAAAGNCANHPNPDEGHPCHYHFAVDGDNHFPSSFDRVIGVGASTSSQTDGMDMESWFTNWGVKVDVSAPGVEIFSCSKSGTQSFGRYSGTSCSSPMVSGLFALLWSRNPSLDKVEVRKLITTTADPMYLPPEKQGKLGSGRINAYKALFAAKYLKPVIGGQLSSGDLDGDDLDETALGLNGALRNTGKLLVFNSFNDEMTNGKLDFGTDNMVSANTFCDLDGDGRDEISVVTLNDPGGFFKIGNGDNNLSLKYIDYTYKSFSVNTLYDFGSNKTSEHLASGDFDGDHADELAIAVQTNPSGYFESSTPENALSLMVIESDGSIMEEILLPDDSIPSAITTGDIDNDSNDEIIFAYTNNPAGIFTIDEGTNEGHLLILDDADAGFVEIPNSYTSIAGRIIEQVLTVNLEEDFSNEIVISTLDYPSGYLEDEIVLNHVSLMAFDDALVGVNQVAWIEFNDFRKTVELTDGNIHPNDDDTFWAWFMMDPTGVDYTGGTPGGRLLMVPYRIDNGTFVMAGSTAGSNSGYRHFSGCIRNGDYDRPDERNETALYAIEGGLFKPHRWFEYHDDIGSGIYVTWEYRFVPYTNFLEQWINAGTFEEPYQP